MPDLPEDRPTEPLRPRAPVATTAAVEREVTDPGWVARLEDEVRSLKGLLALVGVLSVAALGLSLYALLADEDDADATGASRERVAQIDERVDRLESRAGDTSEESDVAKVQEELGEKADQADVDELATALDELQSSVDAGGDDDAVAQELASLREDLDTLAAEVEQMQQDSGQSP